MNHEKKKIQGSRGLAGRCGWKRKENLTKNKEKRRKGEKEERKEKETREVLSRTHVTSRETFRRAHARLEWLSVGMKAPSVMIVANVS